MDILSFGRPERTEREDELRTAPFTRLHPGSPAVPFGDLPHDRQSRSGSLDFPSDRPLEELEDTFRMLRRDPRPPVANHKADDLLVRFGLIGGDLDFGSLTVSRKLQRVRNQIVDP